MQCRDCEFFQLIEQKLILNVISTKRNVPIDFLMMLKQSTRHHEVDRDGTLTNNALLMSNFE